LNAFSSASRALSCVSVSSKRTFTELASSCSSEGWMPCAASVCSTRVTVPVSMRTVERPAETCTAGDSPNRLGNA
jgi:hypothetical protein